MTRHRANNWPAVVPCPDGRYRVDLGRALGKRTIRHFTTQAEAQDWAEEKRTEARNMGTQAAALLTPAAKRDAVEALRLLDGRGTLRAAAEYFVKFARPVDSTVTFAQLVKDYLAAKEAANRRHDTIRDYRDRLNRVALAFGRDQVADITAERIVEWLATHHYAGLSRRNYMRVLSGLFAFAVRRSLLPANPIATIDVPTLDERTPDILTVDQAAALLHAAETAHPDMVPYYAIALFAGLRPSELTQLKPAGIDAKYIRVTPETAKRRRQRLVDVSPNLAAWLERYPVAGAAVPFSRRHHRHCRTLAGITWAADILRHTYVSHHLAQHENAAATALQAGHLTSDVMFNHYRNLVTRADASRFWAITPTGQSQVLPFRLPATA